MAWAVRKLTEEGKAMFSWQFDEMQDMEQVRSVVDTYTKQIHLCIKVNKDDFQKMQEHGRVHHKREFHTKRGIWFMFDDGYDNYIYREGDIL